MSVVTARNADGDVAVGVEVEGAFVAFATIPAYRIQHAVERQKTLTERAEANDAEAQQVLESDFQVVKASANKRASKEASA